MIVGVVGKRVDPLADDSDVGMVVERVRDLRGESVAIDRQRRARGHLVHVGARA